MPRSTFNAVSTPGSARPKLDQRDRDRGLHADEHCPCVENPGHAGNIPDHAPHERIDHLECGDVDEDAARTLGLDRIGQIVLQAQRQLIMHVDLQRDEQELAHPQYGNAIHRLAA